jgi:hypothetical protein
MVGSQDGCTLNNNTKPNVKPTLKLTIKTLEPKTAPAGHGANGTPVIGYS